MASSPTDPKPKPRVNRRPRSPDKISTANGEFRASFVEAEWVRGVLRSADDRGALYSVIMLSAAGTVLPELLDFFAGDSRRVLEMIERFAGTVVKFPTRAEVLAMTRRVSVLRDVLVDGMTYQDTAERHGISHAAAREVYRAGVRILVEQGVLTKQEHLPEPRS
jgi:uncharacterized protein YerC